jgi:hypothetical protein
LVSSAQRILFLMVWVSFGAFLQTPSRLSCAFYWGVASVWPIYHNGRIGGVLQRWLSFWKVLPSPQRNSRARVLSPLPEVVETCQGCFTHHLPTPLLHYCYSVHHICIVTLTISTCTYYLNQPD